MLAADNNNGVGGLTAVPKGFVAGDDFTSSLIQAFSVDSTTLTRSVGAKSGSVSGWDLAGCICWAGGKLSTGAVFGVTD